MNAPVRTTEQYIATFPEEIQQLLAEVAAAMRRALPRAEERIRYGMPALRLGERRALHFAGGSTTSVSIPSRPWAPTRS